METMVLNELREQLDERKRKLQRAISSYGNVQNLIELLQSVDSALERMDNGTYGYCEICHDPIEKERLLADPLITVCLDDLSEKQQKHLEEDISLASRIQRELLPKNDYKVDGWEICFYYSPAGAVSGDYCDIIINKDDNPLLFCLGDVSGKGIAASLLMSHLHAMFHSLASFNLPLNELTQRANRLFCESTPMSHYATLINARAAVNGEVEICNAGHCYPLLISESGIYEVKSTGLPIGMFHDSTYQTEKIKMNKGDVLFLYTDGLSESAVNGSDYGDTRLLNVARQFHGKSPQQIMDTVLDDLKTFMLDSRSSDDLTIMVVRRNT